MTWVLRRAEIPSALVRDLTGRDADPGSPRPGSAPRVDGTTWLDQLPRLVDDALARWHLRLDTTAALRAGSTALVVPVSTAPGTPAVLKVGWPHRESDTEHLALRTWGGQHAVRLLAADPPSGTLLLERLDADPDLTSGSAVDSVAALGEVLRGLDRPSPGWAPPLSGELVTTVEELERFHADADAAHLLPRRMSVQAASLAADLLTEGAEVLDARLVHSDLHQLNVLRRDLPGEWVAIDPKPLAGDPHWAVAPALWNRWAEVRAAHDPRGHLRLRVGILCETAGLDEDRARAMTIVRLVRSAVWALGAADADAARWVEKAVTIVKAMQPG
ncbi:aminoglycoside phosphotransferase family protein [Ornithinimicrobium tianjinense]|uniref:Streptomycin 6-kinase n=1 Tax=Ornithinimicrobium tianjinense TaxID=1195761 RepID=A0A917F4J5_9MICO|nr:aminoglycoside phosphotransferase family protein [Ornithinimicrobium tianjinense]GGF49846.1 streptomycin 6-kinase [Ornithinimicrobium tianjinense]